MGSELGVDMKIALSGGPMGGLEIDDVGQAFAVLTDDDGKYWRYERRESIMVFVGEVS